MKKIFFLFTAIPLSFSSIAQDTKFEFGVQAGPNITTMQYTSAKMQSNSSPRMAFMAGFFTQYNISKTFALRIDPAFERLSNTVKAGLYDQNGNTISATTRLTYDYISIPLLVRANMGSTIRYFAHAGPCLGLLFNQSSASDGSGKINNTAYYQTLNFGITGGIGVAFPIKEKYSLSFEVRDNVGLTNINVSTNANKAVRTNVTSLLIGFSYKLRKAPANTKFTPTF